MRTPHLCQGSVLVVFESPVDGVSQRPHVLLVERAEEVGVTADPDVGLVLGTGADDLDDLRGALLKLELRLRFLLRPGAHITVSVLLKSAGSTLARPSGIGGLLLLGLVKYLGEHGRTPVGIEGSALVVIRVLPECVGD